MKFSFHTLLVNTPKMVLSLFSITLLPFLIPVATSSKCKSICKIMMKIHLKQHPCSWRNRWVRFSDTDLHYILISKLEEYGIILQCDGKHSNGSRVAKSRLQQVKRSPNAAATNKGKKESACGINQSRLIISKQEAFTQESSNASRNHSC